MQLKKKVQNCEFILRNYEKKIQNCEMWTRNCEKKIQNCEISYNYFFIFYSVVEMGFHTLTSQSVEKI